MGGETGLGVTASENDSDKTQGDTIAIPNNTITCNHSLNRYLQIEKGPDGRLSMKIRRKDWVEWTHRRSCYKGRREYSLFWEGGGGV